MRHPITLKTGIIVLSTFALGANSFSDMAWAQAAFTSPCDSVIYDQPNGIRGTISVPGEEDCYTFKGEAGQRVNLYLFGSRQTLRLISPDSSVLAFCHPLSGDCEIDNVTLPVSGIYTLTVAFDGDATGFYMLFLNRLDGDTKPITFDQIIDDNIHPVGDQDSFTFSGQAGQRITAALDAQFSLGAGQSDIKQFISTPERSGWKHVCPLRLHKRRLSN